MEIEDQDGQGADAPMFEQPTEHVPTDTGADTPAEDGVSTEYAPNFEYQFRGEQRTFDERLHPIVTNKETEDFLRDTFTRADGLDAVKTRLDESETKYGDLQSRYDESHGENQNFRSNLERLNGLKESDPMGFQRQWGLSDKWVLDRATSILEHHDNPAQGQLAEQAYSARQENWQTQQSSRAESEKSGRMERELHTMKMTNALNSDEISSFAKNYDSRMGNGAFRAQVDDFGSLQYHSNKRYVDPQVAVSEVYGKLQKMWGPATPTSLSPDAPRTPPIPNMGAGRSGAPTSKRFNTLAELRAHASTLGAQS